MASIDWVKTTARRDDLGFGAIYIRDLMVGTASAYCISLCISNCKSCSNYHQIHYCDVIMGTMASQITSLTMVYSTVHSGADQRKHQISASLALVRGSHRWPVNCPRKCCHLMTSPWLEPNRAVLPCSLYEIWAAKLNSVDQSRSARH